jgi:hypothetical protein
VKILMYRILTIEREFGCGAGDIAEVLAERLGWKLWDQALTKEIAREANVDPSAVATCDERCDSTFHRLAKVFWRGSYERSMPLGSGTEPFDADRFVAIGDQVMNRIAESGECVIVGRGAPYFLRRGDDYRNNQHWSQYGWR